MLRNVKGWLEGTYDIFPANSGAMALKCLASNRPDLVLLFNDTLGADAKLFMEKTQEKPEVSSIPTLFLHDRGDKGDIVGSVDGFFAEREGICNV